VEVRLGLMALLSEPAPSDQWEIGSGFGQARFGEVIGRVVVGVHVERKRRRA